MALTNTTINSPGVQITEKDLTLRVSTTRGTTVFVPGFASQGPISEPIQITTASEFEAIFGVPTNAAERYFYYSCREVLNSPGQLIAARLPYGQDAGTTHTTKAYSALFYPASLSNSVEQLLNDGTIEPEWKIGAPIHKTLNYAEYQALLQNDFEWAGTSEIATTYKAVDKLSPPGLMHFGDGFPTFWNGHNLEILASNYSSDPDTLSSLRTSNTPLLFDTIAQENVLNTYPDLGLDFFNTVGVEFNNSTGLASFTLTEPSSANDFTEPTYEVQAGFMVLNDLQTSINEIAEGYYIGFADNLSVYSDSPNFDSIKLAETLVDDSGNVAVLPTDRLEFALSATKIDSDQGVTSVSESLEKVGFVGFEQKLYQDHISFGVYRIRRSTVDPTKLSLLPAEKYLGSFDSNRKQVNQAGGKPLNAFIEDLVNTGSPSIKFFINPAISRQFDWTNGTYATEPVARITVADEAKKLSPVGVYVPDTRSAEASKVVGNVPQKIDKLFRTIESPENVTLDIVTDAGLSTIFASTWHQLSGGITAFNDEKYITNVENDTFYQQSWKSVVIPLINFVENTRRDCIVIIDPPRALFVAGRDSKVVDQPDKNFTTSIYNPLKNLASLESNYATMYGNWIKINDVYSGRRFWMPMSGFAAAVFTRSDAATQPWYPPAGLNRGTFNAIDIAFNPNQKQRDRFYEISVNPVVFFNGDGHVIMGQKTLQTRPTAFDRINVRRLFLILERSVSQTVKYFVFEPNTMATRSRLVNTIGPLFEFAKNNEGLYDYLIVCDERNNTPDTIDNNELIVDIYLKPVRAAEFILINFIATRTGQDFTELI